MEYCNEKDLFIEVTRGDFLRFLEREIQSFFASAKREEMLTGKRYYEGDHDVLYRERTAIGEGGEICRVDNLPENRIVNNQYARLVDQKVNYSLSRPFLFECEDARIRERADCFSTPRFRRDLIALGTEAMNCGIAYLHPYFDEGGQMQFRLFSAPSVMPLWRDEAHTELDCAMRFFEREEEQGDRMRRVRYGELYTARGVALYRIERGRLVYVSSRAHLYGAQGALGFGRVPLVPFKFCEKEIPLIRRAKCLQDAINTLLSEYADNMMENPRNCILVLKNFDGQDLGEFRRNLAAYGAVKVRSEGGGGVETLSVAVNSENYKSILDMLSGALVENCRGFDSRDDRFSSSPNQMNIMAMFSDIDLDAATLESQFAASMEELMYFVTFGLTSKAKTEIRFVRNLLINESEKIASILASEGLLSKQTLLEEHPYVSDVRGELQRLAEESGARPIEEQKG